jgi:hypothetical protein
VLRLQGGLLRPRLQATGEWPGGGAELAVLLPCLEGAFEWGWRRGCMCVERVGKRERLRRYVHDPTEWPSSNVDADSRGRRLLCVGEGCGCDSVRRRMSPRARSA